MKLQIALSAEVPTVELFKRIFPNSSISVFSGRDQMIYTVRLAKDKTEVANGIMENDPLSYSFTIDSDNTYTEHNGVSLAVKPPVGSHLAFGRIKLRAKTIKNVNNEKLLRRFMEVRKFAIDNGDQLKDPKFDIKTK